MNRNRNLLATSLGLALTAVLSCTAGEMPLATQLDGDTTAVGGLPPTDAPTLPVDTIAAPGDTGTLIPVDTVETPRGGTLEASLLACKTQPYAVATAVIGPNGGQIVVGDHTLKILEGALSEPVTITAEQVAGTINSVRFRPEGLRFAIPAVLSLGYKNCDNVRHYKRVVYTDEQLNILEPTLSYDFSNSSQVKSLIYHFSRYAVAY